MTDINRLTEILWEIKELINEANDIFSNTKASGRFAGYPYPHIIGALDSDHSYLGGSFITMMDCIQELETDEEDES